MICAISILSGHSFAQGEAIKIKELKINDRVIPENKFKITLYKAILPGGKLYITGKASSTQGPIESVEVTVDNKKTWKKAFVLSPEGEFQIGLRLKAPETYVVCVKATDSKGRQNHIDETCREVFISDKTPYMLVRETLDALIDAYETKNLHLFLSLFSDNFYGDKTILDTSMRLARNRYLNVDIRYTLNSVVPDYSDKIFASVTFNRTYTIVKTGKTVTDMGATTFVFEFDNGNLKVLSMARPLMFLE